jgi:hypothetical protein
LLEVGAISETVTVSADAPLLRMDSGEMAQCRLKKSAASFRCRDKVLLADRFTPKEIGGECSE